VGAFAVTLSSQLRAAERLAVERAAALIRERDARVRAASDLVAMNLRVRELETKLGALRPNPDTPAPAPAPQHSPPSGHVRPHKDPKAPRGTQTCKGDGDPLNGCLN
jgi:hypothetical protein